MGWYIYIAEIGALLLVAYSVGWVIGYAARGFALRKPTEASVPASIPAARLELAKGEGASAPVAATALAVETVIPEPDPVPVQTAPVPVSSEVPVAVEAVAPVVRVEPVVPVTEPVVPQAGTEAEMAPPQVTSPSTSISAPTIESTNPVAEQEASGPPEFALPGTEPLTVIREAPTSLVSALADDDESGEFVILRRTRGAAPSAPAEAAPASAPGMAWAGQINGHAAPLHAGAVPGAEPGQSVPTPPATNSVPQPAATPEPLATAAAEASPPVAGQSLEPPPQAEVRLEPAIAPEPIAPAAHVVVPGREPAPPVVDHDAMFAAMVSEPAADADQGAPVEDTDDLPAVYWPEAEVEVEPEPAFVSPEVDVDPPPSAPEISAPSEDDAMRAIEGGWSRASTPADKPQLTEIAAAVAAAQNAVRQAVELTGAPASVTPVPAHGFGKPMGLPRPLDGRRDNLREIEGLSPLDESTLNNLGIFHFEQIAEWTPQEVFWLENHVFARGRIGRETWQLQARDLMSTRPSPSRAARP